MKIKIQILLLVISLSLNAQVLKLDTLAELPKEVSECSAMTLSGDGGFWVLNDSGNEPILYKFDKNGKWITEVLVRGKNKDWEALTRDAKGNLYIGDIGNNNNKRKDLLIYKIPEPTGLKSAKPDTLKVKYTSQKKFPPAPSNLIYDAEGILVEGQEVVIFSKNRTHPFNGFTYYFHPTDSGYTKTDSLFLGEGFKEENWVTEVALSPSQNVMALLGYGKMWIIFDFPEQRYFEGSLYEVAFPFFSQKEAMVFKNDTTLLLADERNPANGGFIYQTSIDSVYKIHQEILKNEVRLDTTGFSDSLLVNLNLNRTAEVYYEWFSYEGKPLNYGKLDEHKKGEHQFKLTPNIQFNGTYILNIIVGSRPHGFIVKKYIPVTKEQLEKGTAPEHP